MIGRPTVAIKADHLWRSHDAAQRHYEKDLDLFATRMNFFLTVDTAVAGLAATRPAADGLQSSYSLHSLGLLVALAWLAVWAGSYRWITKWRRELVRLGGDIQKATGVSTASLMLLSAPLKWRWLTLMGRPTGIMLLPLLGFLAYWLLLVTRDIL
jgi:hypothetical protein